VVSHFRYEVPGDRINDYDSVGARSVALASGRGEAHVWLLTFEPLGLIGPHTAGFDQLFFVIEGSAWVIVDGERTELAAHEAATIDLGQYHSKGSEHGARVLMVQLSSLEEPRQ
jgi:quercetin dioxygenase-like cupin family protein